jgi:hypothetical protein
MSPLDDDASQEPPGRSAEAIASVPSEAILVLGNAGCSVRFYRSPAGDGFAFW